VQARASSHRLGDRVRRRVVLGQSRLLVRRSVVKAGESYGLVPSKPTTLAPAEFSPRSSSGFRSLFPWYKRRRPRHHDGPPHRAADRKPCQLQPVRLQKTFSGNPKPAVGGATIIGRRQSPESDPNIVLSQDTRFDRIVPLLFQWSGCPSQRLGGLAAPDLDARRILRATCLTLSSETPDCPGDMAHITCPTKRWWARSPSNRTVSPLHPVPDPDRPRHAPV